MDGLIFFLGGAVLANGLPHVVQGMSGRAFPTPFARPRGRGESSALLNVFWGAANLAVGYLLLFHLAQFDPRSLAQIAAAGAGALLLAVGLAWRFGPIYGGDRRGETGGQSATPPRGGPGL